jgi:thiol-disulfide isomerase/thioredoxin
MKVDEFKTLRKNMREGEIMVLKFGAEWCKPCKQIKPLVDDQVKCLPQNVKFYEIDIDKSVELYIAFKSKKMIKGVPTLLSFLGEGGWDHWYIPDDIVSGTDECAICNFFETITP